MVSFTQMKGGCEGEQVFKGRWCCIRHRHWVRTFMPWRRHQAAQALAECKTPGQGCSCPPADCQVHPSLSRLLGPLHHHLWSPGLLTAQIQLSFPVFTFRPVFWHFLTTPLPLAPIPYSLHQSIPPWSLFPYVHISKLGNWRKEEKVRDSIHVSFQPRVHKHADTHMHTHAFILSLSLPVSLHQKDLPPVWADLSKMPSFLYVTPITTTCPAHPHRTPCTTLGHGCTLPLCGPAKRCSCFCIC